MLSKLKIIMQGTPDKIFREGEKKKIGNKYSGARKRKCVGAN